MQNELSFEAAEAHTSPSLALSHVGPKYQSTLPAKSAKNLDCFQEAWLDMHTKSPQDQDNTAAFANTSYNLTGSCSDLFSIQASTHFPKTQYSLDKSAVGTESDNHHLMFSPIVSEGSLFDYSALQCPLECLCVLGDQCKGLCSSTCTDMFPSNLETDNVTQQSLEEDPLCPDSPGASSTSTNSQQVEDINDYDALNLSNIIDESRNAAVGLPPSHERMAIFESESRLNETSAGTQQSSLQSQTSSCDSWYSEVVQSSSPLSMTSFPSSSSSAEETTKLERQELLRNQGLVNTNASSQMLGMQGLLNQQTKLIVTKECPYDDLDNNQKASVSRASAQRTSKTPALTNLHESKSTKRGVKLSSKYNWDERLLTMDRAEFVNFTRTNKQLTKDQLNDLRRTRRRMKNRLYQKDARDRRYIKVAKERELTRHQLQVSVRRLTARCFRLESIIRTYCPEQLTTLSKEEI
eukprot:gene7603-9868_t